VTANKAISRKRRLCSALLVGTILGGLAVPAYAQVPPAPAAAPVASPQAAGGVVQSIAISGNQRMEAETVLSYMGLRIGEPYDQERLDQVLRDLYATELFADVVIAGAETGNIVVQVRENPVINRIVVEGNRRIKDDKILPEIRLAPRQIFTRSRARADVARIVELYRRQGRFAAQVEPKIVQLDQNRVDVVFEVEEGPRSRVRQINVIGNEQFSDGQLRAEMATRQARFYRFFSSADSYDPDRLAFDQQKLRLFYLTQGYADFRVVSAVAELTPDRRDFIITYVVEEGERYRFGDVSVESAIRDFRGEDLQAFLPMRSGQWYNAQQVEDTITTLSETAGVLGYAFADVRPAFERNRETLTMDVVFRVAEAPRVYVERIEITGNTNTRDNVIRREFRLAEGDPFNAVRVRRSRDRIQSLGFFQDNLEIQQQPGSAPDRVVLAVEVEERSTGELQLSAGFSSLERFLVNAQIRQRNFMGKGQELRAGINYSSYAKSAELGFTEPYLFGRNIAVGGDIFRRDFNSFNILDNRRQTTYQQVTTGGQIRGGIPLTEHLTVALRYGLTYDQVQLSRELFFSPDPVTGELVCDPLLAGRYLCQAIGNRVNSSVGYSLVYDTLNNRLRPSRGERAIFSQDFAGLGGDVRYLRSRAEAAKYWGVGRGFIFSLSLQGGYIHSFESAPAPDIDPVRLIDRFTLGEPQIRGFDIRGIGPRVLRYPFDEDGQPIRDRKSVVGDDPLGGRAFYLGRAELEIPLGSGARDLGLRPSVFLDVGALFGLRRPDTDSVLPGDPRTISQCRAEDGVLIPVDAEGCPDGTTFFRQGVAPFLEEFVGNTPRPRVSIGFGVNWNSPFGPFRIDIAKALISAEGDDTKLFSFNVGTSF
jgi:outer membrane protein insertion porin family